MEKKIVKVPKNEIVVALGRSEAYCRCGARLEKDFAINQQGKKLNPGKMVGAQPSDLLWCRQYGQGSCNLRIADFEQRAGPRRFQDDLVATPSHVSEPRQDESVCIANRHRSRPIVGNLWLDDDQVLAISRAPKAVLQKSMPGQSPDQEIKLLVDFRWPQTS